MGKRTTWRRNADSILTCEHDNPLHDDCVLCMMREEYDQTDRAIQVAAFIFFVAAILVVVALRVWS